MTYEVRSGDELQSQDDEMPRQVKAARLLLLLGLAVTAMTIVTAPLVLVMNAAAVGYLTLVCWPGIAALVIAVKLRTGGRHLFWVTMGVCGYWSLAGLVSLVEGSPKGLTQLIIPAGVIVLLTRPPARTYLSRDLG